MESDDEKPTIVENENGECAEVRYFFISIYMSCSIQRLYCVLYNFSDSLNRFSCKKMKKHSISTICRCQPASLLRVHTILSGSIIIVTARRLSRRWPIPSMKPVIFYLPSKMILAGYC